MPHAACDKAVCRALNVALLSFKKLDQVLRRSGLLMNPCDPCAWNHMVDGLKLTMLFHIDDLLLPHAGPEIATHCVMKLDVTRDSKDSLTVTRGNTHD